MINKRTNKKIFFSFVAVISLTFAFYLSSCGSLLPNLNMGYVQIPDLNDERCYHSSVAIDEKRVLVTGGMNSPENEEQGIKTAEIYFEDKNKFVKTSDMILPHVYHKMFKMSDGNIVIADINGIEIFDVKKAVFKLLNTKPEKRYREYNNYAFALLPDDLLFIGGGRFKSEKNKSDLSDINLIEIIDLKKDKLIKQIDFKNNQFQTLNMPNGNLLIIGGKIRREDKEEITGNISLFSPKDFTIKKWGDLKIPVSNPFIFMTKNNEIVVLGGEIYEKSETVAKYEYALTKGSNSIEIVDLKTKDTRLIDINKTLKDSIKNSILDAIQISDSLYLLRLKSGKQLNTVIYDLNKNKAVNIDYLFGAAVSAYRSSGAKITNGILYTGGKFLWEEADQYSIYDNFHPDSETAYKGSSKYATKNAALFKIK